jgi:probable HAF family extracellular repeat protein
MATSAVLTIPGWVTAQEQAKEDHRKHHHYKLIDVGTLGGPSSYFSALSLSDRFGFSGPFGFAPVVNKKGILAGWADTTTPDPFAPPCFNPDCFVSHTFQWRNGEMTDLGALPGGGSSASLWINNNASIVGYSQNGQVDPLSGLAKTRAVLWDRVMITDLGTLGGNESYSTAINNRGDIVRGYEHDS